MKRIKFKLSVPCPPGTPLLDLKGNGVGQSIGSAPVGDPASATEWTIEADVEDDADIGQLQPLPFSLHGTLN